MKLLRRLRDALAALLFAVFPAHAATADFVTLNALHYGWSTTQVKEQTIKSVWANIQNLQGIFLQEVMPGANLSAIMPHPNFFICESPAPLGYGTYKEKYAILVNPALTAAISSCLPYPDPTYSDFSRPPLGAGITTSAGGKDLWIIDYHAVFGKSITARKKEISQVKAAVLWFQQQKSAAVIVAGDWNLRGNVPPMDAWTVEPRTLLTSLNQSGNWSQAYDHFVLFGNASFPNNPCNYYLPGTQQSWRKDVSDHVPVHCKIDY